MRILFLLLLVNVAFAQSLPKSDHCDGEHFFNPGFQDKENSFFDFLKWKMKGGAKDWPENVPNVSYPKPVLDERSRAIFTFINHATYLIQTKSINVITDPVFSERVSPLSWIGPKRVRMPGLAFEDLPPIDVVLISHSHYDHMDLPSLIQIDAKFHPLFLVPFGNEKRLKEAGIQNVKELDWWQEVKVKDATITLTRVLHWANRTLTDAFESLWGGYMVSTPQTKFYFAGDTGYADHFKETFTKLGAPDVAILPIGAYEPRWFMKIHHLNPEEAVQAHKDLQTKVSLPMHFGTFQLTDEGYDDPVIELKRALEKHQLPAENFPILDQGQSHTLL